MKYFCIQEYSPWHALLRKFGRNPRSQGSVSNVGRTLENYRAKWILQVRVQFATTAGMKWLECTTQEFRCDCFAKAALSIRKNLTVKAPLSVSKSLGQRAAGRERRWSRGSQWWNTPTHTKAENATLTLGLRSHTSITMKIKIES